MPSPKVTTSVDDQTTRVSTTGTYSTAVVVASRKGPVNKPVKIGSQTELLRKFTPDETLSLVDDGSSLYDAYNYLGLHNGLYVCRAAHTQVTGSTGNYALYGGCIIYQNGSASTNIALTTGLADPTARTAQTGEALLLCGVDQGTYNNDLSIKIATTLNTAITGTTEKLKIPGTFFVMVYKKGVLVENHTCSMDPSLKNGYGVNCYVNNVLSGSNYIQGISYQTAATTIYEVTATSDESPAKTYTLYTSTQGASGSAATVDNCRMEKYLQTAVSLPQGTSTSPITYTYAYNGNTTTAYPVPKDTSGLTNQRVNFGGGADGDAATTADRIRALDKFKNNSAYNIQLIMDGGYTDDAAYATEINEVCIALDDSCHGIIGTPYSAEVSNDARAQLLTYRNETTNLNSASMEMYTTHQKVYDEFNDRYIYLSPTSFVAAMIVKNAEQLGWHWAVAGYNRGVVNSVDVAATFEASTIDDFSDAQINTIVKVPGRGNVIMDELTQLSAAQDLQDCHISRWVNIHLRPKLKDALRSFLFEFNDSDTRQLVINLVDSFMQSEKASRACYAYRIVCSEENNTASDIENNILNCWLYVKPTKISKWIKQRVILSAYSVDLEAIEI